jgi:arylsulfatase A-like enzyme
MMATAVASRLAGVVAALVLAVNVTGCTRLSTPPRPPDILLISIDTLRADHLGAWGWHRPTSPNLDRLAAGGIRFADAASQAPWTTPSHMTMLTGLYPSTHGVNQGFGDFLTFAKSGRGYRRLSGSVTTLAEALRDAGYRTRGLGGGGTIGGDLGFKDGFEDWHDGPQTINDEVKQRVRAILDGERDQPLFFFWQTFHVHAPYLDTRFVVDGLDDRRRRKLAAEIEAIVRGERGQETMAFGRALRSFGLYQPQYTSALYDGGIAAIDEVLGEVFAWLRDNGRWEQTVVVVTADHGEEFADHRPDSFYDSHCATVYQELLHVPLIVHGPGIAQGVVEEPVGVIDIAPTLLELAGARIPQAMQGVSLVPLLRNPDEKLSPRVLLAEATCTGPEQKSWREGPTKLIARYRFSRGSRGGLPGPRLDQQLYDLDADPGEHSDLAAGDAARRDQLLDRLERRFAANASAAPTDERSTDIDEASRQRLRKLGYID